MGLGKVIILGLAQNCAPTVAPSTMEAVIMAESRGNPFAIGINGKAKLARQPENVAEAIATARDLMRRKINFDAGLAQINSANFAALGLTPETVFDHCTNVRAGAKILTDNYIRAQRSGAEKPLIAALSAYNTGSMSRGVSNGYVNRVFDAAAPSSSASKWNVSSISQLLVRGFGGRITDTIRPINASYGAQHSYHKIGQAVDFVPQGGVNAVSRQAIRSLLERNGVQIIELLGPGDRGHADHWHIAFGERQSLPKALPAAFPVTLAAVTETGDLGEDAVAPPPPPPPPTWDVFARARWARSQPSTGGGQ